MGMWMVMMMMTMTASKDVDMKMVECVAGANADVYPVSYQNQVPFNRWNLLKSQIADRHSQLQKYVSHFGFVFKYHHDFFTDRRT